MHGTLIPVVLEILQLGLATGLYRQGSGVCEKADHQLSLFLN